MTELWSVLDAPCEQFELRGQHKRMTWLTPRGRDSGAEAFYSETLGAGAVTRAHFHEVDQFQLFVEGRQRVGSATVEPVTLHYADAHTPYGPIVGDETGVHYLTYRSQPDPGARWMPESRHLRRRRGGRHATVRVPLDLTGPDWVDLVPPAADGLGAAVRTAAPGERIVDERPVVGEMRALVVVAGSIVVDDRDHGRLSSVVVSRGDAVPSLHAGAEGVTLVSLDFPVSAGTDGS